MIYSDYILLKLNFISPEKDTSNNNIVNFNESSLKLVEKKLVCEIYENLKNSEGYIDKDQLLLFLLSLINLYEYYLLKINKHKFNLPEITCELKEKYRNEMIKSKSRSQEKFSFNKIRKMTKHFRQTFSRISMYFRPHFLENFCKHGKCD